LRASIEGMLDPFAILTAVRDGSGRIVDFRLAFVNGATRRLFGLAGAGAVGVRLLRALPAHRHNGLFEAYCRVVESGEPLVIDEMEYVDHLRDGRQIQFILDLRVARVGDGVALSGRDATGRRAAEATQGLLAAAMEHAAESIVVVDTDGLVRFANRAYERASGYSASEVIGKHRAIVFGGSWAAAPEVERLDLRLRTGLPWSGDRELRRRDGTTYIEEVTISPVRDPAGLVMSYVRVARDVTHVRAIEASLEVTTRERVAFAHALGRLQQRATPEETGRDITDEIAGLEGITYAAILTFEEPDGARALALTDPAAVSKIGDLVAGQLLPLERATYLRERAVLGPWAEPWVAREVDGTYGTAVEARGIQAVAYAPIGDPGEPIGLIALGTTDEQVGRSIADVLPAAIEFAAAAGGLIAAPLAIRRRRLANRRRIEGVIASTGFATVFQPVIDLKTGAAVGFEGLTRFRDRARPDHFFADAWSSGIGPELEAVTLESTIAASLELPPGPWLGLNVSAAMILEPGRLARILAGRSRPVVLEITEHDVITDYSAVRAAVALLGPDVRIAVDDAGAGAANFTHIVELRPDFVKIDVGLVRGVDRDLTRQALVVGLGHFARAIDGWVIAEGIETEEERQALIALGVELGQGFLLGRPAAVATWVALGPAA